MSAAIAAQLPAEAVRQRSEAIAAESDAASRSQRSLAISAQLDLEGDRELDVELDAMLDESVDAVTNSAVDFIPCETAVPSETPRAAARHAVPMPASARAGVSEGKVGESQREVEQSRRTAGRTLEIRACNAQCGRCEGVCVAEWRRWSDERPASFMTYFYAEPYKRGIGNYLCKKCAPEVHGWLA